MVVGFAAPASAQTADGMTPSEETICDAEVGKAFGFCNAYCEAMDCDSEFANASDKACFKVEDKFFEVAGRDLPCEIWVPDPATCPCTSFSTAASGDIGVLATSIRQFAVGRSPNEKLDRFRCTEGVFGNTGFSLKVEFAELPAEDTDDVLVFSDAVMEFFVAAEQGAGGEGSCTVKVEEGEGPSLRIYEELKFNALSGGNEIAFPPFMYVPSRTTADFLACQDLYPTVEASIRAGLDTIFQGTNSSSCTFP